MSLSKAQQIRAMGYHLIGLSCQSIKYPFFPQVQRAEKRLSLAKSLLAAIELIFGEHSSLAASRKSIEELITACQAAECPVPPSKNTFDLHGRDFSSMVPRLCVLCRLAFSSP